jgi:hypothetical protein
VRAVFAIGGTLSVALLIMFLAVVRPEMLAQADVGIPELKNRPGSLQPMTLGTCISYDLRATTYCGSPYRRHDCNALPINSIPEATLMALPSPSP